jgi:hypothetical protein
LVTLATSVATPPSVKGAPGARSATWRSGAVDTTVVGSDARSFVESTSPAVIATAVLVTDGSAARPTATSSVNVAESPGAIGPPYVASTMPAAWTNDQSRRCRSERQAGRQRVAHDHRAGVGATPMLNTVMRYWPAGRR